MNICDCKQTTVCPILSLLLNQDLDTEEIVDHILSGEVRYSVDPFVYLKYKNTQ